ncbi:MAG: hypothetical protein ABIH74_00865 [Candidatus Omnitrophota bacterium]
MKMTIIVIIALFLLPMVSEGQEKNRIEVGLNGESWEKIKIDIEDGPETEREIKLCKKSFIRGVYEGFWNGLMISAANEDEYKSTIGYYYYNTDYETMISAIDRFYDDRANRGIPVVDALRIVALEFKGTDNRKINNIVQSFRRDYPGK